MYSRRRFLELTGTTSASLLIPRFSRSDSPSDKLNIGFIGAGGQAGFSLAGCSSENIVALADVDDARAQGAFNKFPQARRYKDFRKMLDAEPSLDAVVVSTPDHMHAPASIAAMQHGKHVYCEGMPPKCKFRASPKPTNTSNQLTATVGSYRHKRQRFRLDRVKQ